MLIEYANVTDDVFNQGSIKVCNKYGENEIICERPTNKTVANKIEIIY